MTNTKTTRIQVFTRENVAVNNGVSVSTVDKWATSGKLFPIKFGGKLFYSTDPKVLEIGDDYTITHYLEIR